MRFGSMTALLAASTAILGVSAGPLAKRQDETTSTASSAPTAGLVVSTMSNGEKTTIEVAAPQPTSSESESAESTATAEASTTVSEDASSTSAAPSKTGTAAPISHDFPQCHATDAAPFCQPNNESTLYVGATYYATWNPDFFPINSTVTVKIQFINDSLQEVWSSPETDNSWGFVAVTMKSEWMQGYDMYNLTFYALNFEADDPTKRPNPYEGPQITLRNEPPRHYDPPPPTKAPDKLGLMIGLPVSLGFVILVVIGLYIGMRKTRKIGLGSIMGCRKKGYGVGKSRTQRMRLGKKGAIGLQDREEFSRPQYQDQSAHAQGNSLGSLVSDDEIRPAPGENRFRDEIDRQRTGR